MNKAKINKLLYVMLCIFSIMVPYLLLGPMEIYVGNIGAFSFSWLNFFIPSLFISLIISFIVAFIVSQFSTKVANFICCIVTSISFLSYIQVMIMNVKLVADDGNGLDFSQIGSFFYINLLIWIAIFIAFIIAFIKIDTLLFRKICLYICGFLCAVQLVALVTLLITTDTDPNKRSYMFSGERQFSLSDDDNILVLILDAYSNRYFEYALENNQNFSDPLNDFTYYSNADSTYIPTFPSIAHMLTGGSFEFMKSNDDWFNKVWSDNKTISFYNKIHESGYDFNLHTTDSHNTIGLYENVEGKIDNAVRSRVNVNRTRLLKLIYKMSAYRYAPYIFKPYLEVLTFEFSKVVSYENLNSAFDNADYLKAIDEKGFSIDPSMRKTINITHIEGIHNVTDINDSISAQDEVMKIVSTYIDSLKIAGKYDDSTIIIMADHGKWGFAEYQPIFFVKAKGEHHTNMQITNAPVSYNDFMATILCLTDNEYSDYGPSIFDLSENEQRVRTLNFISESEQTLNSYEYTGDINNLVEEMTKRLYGE